MSHLQFVSDNSATNPVKRLCQLLEVRGLSFYAWQAGAPARAQRAAAHAEPEAGICKVHAADHTVGAPRTTAELNDGAKQASGSTTSGWRGCCAARDRRLRQATQGPHGRA